MDVWASTPATIRVDFLNASGTLVPDANSVSYTVFATDGSVLVTPTAIATTPTDTGVTITVPGADNTITPPRLFEKRLIFVSITSGLTPYSFQASYRVVPVPLFSVTANDVRLIFGGDCDEVEDDEIDLTAAYFQVSASVVALNSQATLAAALSSGTIVELMANQAIAGQAVMTLLPGLRARMMTMQKDGQTSFQRGALNWDDIERRARTLVSQGVAAAAGVTETAPTYLAVADNILPVVPSGGGWIDISNPDSTPTNFDPVTSWAGWLSWP
jgi:hypothetical protein